MWGQSTLAGALVMAVAAASVSVLAIPLSPVAVEAAIYPPPSPIHRPDMAALLSLNSTVSEE